MMRRLSVIIFSITGLSLNAFAAETGTYRPGEAYHSVTASSPSQCAAQCSGDAQCKGWNFIRPRQMSRTGVCEFNARSVTPVPSPVSVSGNNATARMSSRIIPAGTNTVRVGTRPALTAVKAVPQKVVSRSVPVMRHSLDTQPSRRAAPGAARPGPQFHYSLDGGSKSEHTQTQTLPAKMAAPQTLVRARFQHSLDGGSYSAAKSAAPQPAVPRLTAQQAPSSLAPTQERQLLASAPRQTPRPAQSERVQMTPHSAPPQQSLYGSLHDDVTVPLTLTPENMPADPDAPIPTVRSVRTYPTESGTLAMMAGAPRL